MSHFKFGTLITESYNNIPASPFRFGFPSAASPHQLSWSYRLLSGSCRTRFGPVLRFHPRGFPSSLTPSWSESLERGKKKERFEEWNDKINSDQPGLTDLQSDFPREIQVKTIRVTVRILFNEYVIIFPWFDTHTINKTSHSYISINSISNNTPLPRTAWIFLGWSVIFFDSLPKTDCFSYFRITSSKTWLVTRASLQFEKDR